MNDARSDFTDETPDATEFEFTPEEVATIERFIIALNSTALRSAIIARVDRLHGSSKAQRRMVRKAIKRVNDTSGYSGDSNDINPVEAPRCIINMAPTFALLVHFARPAPSFDRTLDPMEVQAYKLPEDFIPSSALQKCLNMYHQIARQMTAPDSNSD